MSLCQSCDSITLKRLLPDLDGPGNPFLEIQPSIIALRLSSQACKLCSLFLHALETSSEYAQLDGSEQSSKSEPVFLIPGDPYYSNPNVSKRVSWLSVQCGSSVSASLSIFADPDDALYRSKDITGRPVSVNAGSLDHLNHLKALVEDCRRNHPECALTICPDGAASQTDTVPLPTRLLDLDFGSDLTGSKIRLVRTLGQTGVYAALSHCWGTIPFLTTTSKTLKRRKQGIPICNLPQTFQDAVKVCRHFGFRWLWCDSLCILQDLEKDWHHESSKMGTVYRNAKLTIGATAGVNGSVGLFVARNPPAIAPVQLPNFGAVNVESFKRTKRNETPQSKVFVSLPHGDYFSGIASSPLQQRAWVIQELILSRRILHFAAEQTFFECQRSCIAEDGTTHLLNGRLKQSFDLRDYAGPEKQDINHHEWIATLPLHRRWSRIVENYTKRSLTKTADKLPALAGLAGEVARRVVSAPEADRYLAGHWMQGLHMSLLWTASEEGSLKTSPKYRAPSWSWASRDGAVVWRLDAAMRHHWTKPAMEVVAAETTPEDAVDVYGSVTAGYLDLRCAMNKARYLDQSQGLDGLVGGVDGLIDGSTALIDDKGHQIGVGFMDETHEKVLTVECTLVSRCEYGSGDNGNRSLGVLLLERDETDIGRIFRRIGAGSLFAMDFFDGIITEQIRLI